MKTTKFIVSLFIIALLSSASMYSIFEKAKQPKTIRTFPCGDGTWETRTFIDQDKDGEYDHVIESPCKGNDYKNPISVWDRTSYPFLTFDQISSSDAELTDGELGPDTDYTITFTDPETGEVLAIYEVINGVHTMSFMGTLVD